MKGRRNMKSRYLMFTTALALFAALALPVRLAAQDSPDHHRPHHHYQLIDLGTLGGPASYIGKEGSTAPSRISR
jgi:hypothetical protein